MGLASNPGTNYVLCLCMISKVAIPIWGDRVSPVMDTASQLALFEIGNDKEYTRQVVAIPALHVVHKIEFLRNTGIRLLICGAISQPMFRMITAVGIKVIPFIRGNIDEVLAAFIRGELPSDNFYLPGYPCQRQRQRRRRYRGQRGPF